MPKLRLFFDECCSKRLTQKLAELYAEDYPGLEIKHLADFFRAGDDDSKWLPLLEQDKEWIVITTDRGKDPKKPKLPVICAELGITHVIFTTGLLRNGYKAHKQALLCVWPQMVRMDRLPRGTRISLGYKFYKGGITQWPTLTIENKSFDGWCIGNGITDTQAT
jgi:hypothetical protein